MKILVTGGTGFIGSHLVDAFKRTNNDIRVLIRRTSKLDFLSTSQISIIYGDLRNYESLKKATTDIDVVFHLAALTDHNASKKNLFDINYTGTVNLAKASAVNKIKHFIYCSSAGIHECYDGIANENCPINPDDTYHESKFLAEKSLKKYNKFFLVTILRPSLVYGPRNLGFRKLITSITKNKINFYIGPKEKVQGIVYVKDVVQAFLLAMKKKKNDVYIVSSENITSKDIVKNIKSVLNVRCLNIWVPAPLARIYALIIGKNKKSIDLLVKNRMYDSSKIRKKLGFKPKVNLGEGLKRTIDWYRSSGYI